MTGFIRARVIRLGSALAAAAIVVPVALVVAAPPRRLRISRHAREP